MTSVYPVSIIIRIFGHSNLVGSHVFR